MATTTPQYETVRDSSGNIYITTGAAQVRRIPSLEEYQQGVAEGLYSGAPRQIDTAPIAGAGGLNYLGGYEVGGNITLSDLKSGEPTGFETQTRTVYGNPIGSPAAATEKTMAAMTNLVQTGSLTGTSTTGTGATATAPKTSYSDEIAKLRRQAAGLENQAFERTTEYTPDNLRKLTPGQQAELRRQRVTALSGQLGNVQAAIKTLQDEEAKALSLEEKTRDYALETLNTYLKYGVLGELAEADQAKLATAAGLDASALKAIAEQATAGEPPELRSVGGDLYSVSWNPETGTFDTSLLIGGGGGSSGGGGGGGSSGGGSSGGSDYGTAPAGGDAGVTMKQLDKYLSGYPTAFKNYVKRIWPNVNFALNSTNIASLYEQFVDQGDPFEEEEDAIESPF